MFLKFFLHIRSLFSQFLFHFDIHACISSVLYVCLLVVYSIMKFHNSVAFQFIHWYLVSLLIYLHVCMFDTQFRVLYAQSGFVPCIFVAQGDFPIRCAEELRPVFAHMLYQLPAFSPEAARPPDRAEPVLPLDGPAVDQFDPFSLDVLSTRKPTGSVVDSAVHDRFNQRLYYVRLRFRI